jgi:hypothetical protein
MLGGPQSRSGRGGEEKNFQPPPRIEPPIVQPVAQSYTDWVIMVFTFLRDFPIICTMSSFENDILFEPLKIGVQHREVLNSTDSS